MSDPQMERRQASVRDLPADERYLRCKDCSQARGYPYKRSYLVALRRTKISASDPPSGAGSPISHEVMERRAVLRRQASTCIDGVGLADGVPAENAS